MKDFWKRRRNRRIAASALAVIMAGFLVWGIFPWQAAASENAVADDITVNKWHDSNALDDSTKNVGRIWTDKSVSTEDVTLTNPKGTKSLPVEKGDSTFLVGLSALSSTAKIMGQTSVPLDIVLVLDVSGSMDDASGGYVETYSVTSGSDTRYFVLVNGNYQEVSYTDGGFWQDAGWYYGGWGNRHYVTPKTSAEDNDSNHVQFYSLSTVKKINTLKNAVNGFIDKSAEENDKRSDVNKQSRISIVKFARNKSDWVGNDTYQSGGYKYNYTQIVSKYKAYTGADKSELKDKVNALNPAGSTAADNAMDLTKNLVEQSKSDAESNTDRKNVKRIVIFFTDGQPTQVSDFSDTVANRAISTANTIKSDASIYTIGVFKDADASITGHKGGGRWTDKERFNAYMHGMSSNYPDAESYDNLGARAQDSNGADTQFYKSATNAADLNNIFNEIALEIVSSAQSPTHVDQGEAPNQSGYITFTDQLGDYMQVDDLKTLVYANEEYKYVDKKETTEGNKKIITYLFDQDIPDTNHVYPEGNLGDIDITVEQAADPKTGDLVTVEIPANLIPLRFYEVTKDGKMTIDETYPMRLFYGVSLKDGVEKQLENPDAELQKYIEANKDGDGNVQFYSNKFDKNGVVDKDDESDGIGASAQFVPASTNDFYYFQNDEILYKDEACTIPVTDGVDTSGSTTYYYQRDYYKLGDDGKAVSEINTVKIPGNSNLLLDGYDKQDPKTGQYYIPAGTPRTTSLSYFTEDKDEGANKTNTATTSLKPVWENKFAGKTVTNYLGNNGRLSMALPGELDVQKTVASETGHAVPDSLKNKEFTYTLELTARDGSTLKGEYTAQKYTGDQTEGDTFRIKPGDKFQMKDNQTLKIYGLEAGTTYKLIEEKTDHYTATAAQKNSGDAARTGTDGNGDVFAEGVIPGSSAASADFTNTYKAEAVTLDGSAAFKAEKNFVTPDGEGGYGSAWDIEGLADSTFTIYLSAYGSDMPMPDDAREIAGRMVSVRTVDKDHIDAVFGDITYTKPGTYSYRITERDPGADKKLGVSYSYAGYTVTVTVVDDGGKLKAAPVMERVRDDKGTELENPAKITDNNAVFTNVYEADSETVDVEASKAFTDHTGNRTLKNGEYTFRVTPITEGAPLPGGRTDYLETTNNGTGVKFDSITFDAKDFAGVTEDSAKIYQYKMEEVLPAGVSRDNPVKDGVTYDTTTYIIQMKVYLKDVDGKATVVVNKTYMDANEKPIQQVPIFRNSYTADPVTLTGNTALHGEKTLNGRDMLADETFDFTLTPANDATTKAIADGVITIANGGDSAQVKGGKNDTAAGFQFGDMKFTKTGTYIFNIDETVPETPAGGMTYDNHTTRVTIVVTDDVDHPGKLKAEVTYDNRTADSATDRAVFKNKYEASFSYHTTGGLLVEKVLNGRTMKQGEFGFTIEAQGDAPAVSRDDAAFTNPQQRASGEADSMQKLLGLHFDQDDAGRTFTYLVKEDKGSAKGVTYDETRFLVAIKVMDKGDGTLYTITTITPQTKGDDGTYTNGTAKEFNSATDPDNKPALRFTNTYEAGEAAPVSVTDGFSKELTGRDWRDSDKFIFTIANIQKPDGVETAPMPAETDVIVTKADLDKNGKAPFDFGSITFTKAGVYKYKVTEQRPVQAGENTIGMNYDLTPRIITVTVTDDGTGQLKAAVTAVENSKTFTNKYVTEDLPLDTACGIKVTKVLHGHDMADGQFEFSLKAKDKASADKLRIDKDSGATFTSTAAAAGETATLLDSLQMTMTQEDVGKTYSYTFAETKGKAAGYTYDENTYQLDITTNDAGDGTLTADVVLTNTKTKKELFRKTVSKKAAAPGDSGVVIPFENRYDGSTDVEGGTAAAISGDKTMEGRKLYAGEFQFKLVTRPADGSKGTVLQSKRNRKDGTIGFDPLSYRTSGNAEGRGVILSDAVKDGYAVKSTNDKGQTVYTLSYRVYEDQEDWTLPNNVTVVNGNFDFTVTVTDDGQGHLTAVTNYPDGSNGKFGFVNQYGAEPVPVELKGSKTLDHESGLNPDSIADKFTFSLSSSTEEAPLPDSKTAKNDADGNITFGQITFKLSDLDGVEPADDGSRSKDFIYTVKETSGSAPGVTNDTGDKTFTLTLKDDGKGHLSVTKNPADGPLFTFTNTYTVSKLPSSITDQVKVTKKLTGRDLKAGEFHFELLEDGEVAARGTNDANGSVTFDKITYTAPGSHTYTVREVKGSAGGVTYDDQTWMIYTQITDQGNGKLKAEHQVVTLKDNELAPVEGNSITFTNKYEPDATTVSVGALKRLTGKSLEDGQFTFRLKDENGKKVAEATNDKDGSILFKALKFDKAGTYRYTISEVNDKQKGITYDSSEKTVIITVKDSGEGYLQAQVESEDQLLFTNGYEEPTGIFGGHGTKTGDSFPLWIPFLLLIAAAAGGSTIFIRRHR